MGRRIAILIVFEALTTALVVVLVFVSFSQITADLEYSERFMLKPTEALPGAIEQATAMQIELARAVRMNEAPEANSLRQQLEAIGRIRDRYETDWVVADSLSPDAVRFRRELAQVGQSPLVDEERSSLATIDQRMQQLSEELPYTDRAEVRTRAFQHVGELKRALGMLLRTNISFVGVNHILQEHRARRMRIALLGIGLASIAASALLGLYVRRAVGPRISAMVRKIRGFQETGAFERTRHAGRDEVAILSNALDAGLGAIKERDQERERFLGIVAHELKTPLTSIVGFAEVAMESPEPTTRRRSLEVLRRQAARLGYVIQDLLLAASARSGQLAFSPAPTELREMVRSTIEELQGKEQRFELDAPYEVFVLADEQLITHALWQIFSYATAIAEVGEVLRVHLRRLDASAELSVAIAKSTIPLDDLERTFRPFTVVQYESRPTRHAVGLHLSREIAHLHGGTIMAREDSDGVVRLRLELPA